MKFTRPGAPTSADLCSGREPMVELKQMVKWGGGYRRAFHNLVLFEITHKKLRAAGHFKKVCVRLFPFLAKPRYRKMQKRHINYSSRETKSTVTRTFCTGTYSFCRNVLQIRAQVRAAKPASRTDKIGCASFARVRRAGFLDIQHGWLTRESKSVNFETIYIHT